MADDVDVPRPRSADQRWQGQEPLASEGTARSARRRRRLILLTGAFLALVSFTIVWFLKLQVTPPAPLFFLTIDIGAYNARHYPTPAFTRQDSELLLRHFPAATKEHPVTQSEELLKRK